MNNNINSFREMSKLKHIIISLLCTCFGNANIEKHITPFEDNENGK